MIVGAMQRWRLYIGPSVFDLPNASAPGVRTQNQSKESYIAEESTVQIDDSRFCLSGIVGH
jgi:hypothetical protein